MPKFVKLLSSIFFVFIISYSYESSAKKAAIVIDFNTKKVLFEINADTRNYPASLTKMMTLYIIFDQLKKGNLKNETLLDVSKNAASRSPSKLYLEAGSSIKVNDAIMALIIKSANDVATVVAENISGSEREFAKLMNKYARKIGMKNTTFKNASGLPNRAQMTTARDMAILSHSLIKNFPEKYKLFSKQKFTWKEKIYKTHNKLMLKYDGADGIKTGYIKASGFQLAFSAKRKNKRLIGIIFGGDSGKKRDQSLKIIMDKVFSELNLLNFAESNQTEKKKVATSSENKKNKDYSIVVGTFKYKKNAHKQIKLIKSKYPKTTKNKNGNIVVININGKKMYESRFEYFTKKEAYEGCKRLKKYKRDCFIRS